MLYCIQNGLTLQTMTVEQYKSFSELFDEGILSAVLPRTAIARRTTHGGSAKSELERQIKILTDEVNTL